MFWGRQQKKVVNFFEEESASGWPGWRIFWYPLLRLRRHCSVVQHSTGLQCETVCHLLYETMLWHRTRSEGANEGLSFRTVLNPIRRCDGVSALRAPSTNVTVTVFLLAYSNIEELATPKHHLQAFINVTHLISSHVLARPPTRAHSTSNTAKTAIK